MNLEIKEDNTAYTFSFDKVYNNLPVNISTATISIESPEGSELVASTAMTILANNASFIQDFSVLTTFKIDRDYKAIMVIDGETHIRLFDIVKYPFINSVTEADLFAENEDVSKDRGEETGKAESGTVNTLTDNARTEADSYWDGGIIEIYPDTTSDEITKHTITSFLSGVITFSPNRSVAVGVNKYNIRRSNQSDIERAGEIVKGDLWKKNQRAYLILDNTQVNNLIIYKFFEKFYFKKRKEDSETDQNNIQYKSYADLYNNEYQSLPLRYDHDESGAIDQDGEERTQKTIRMIR